MRLQLRAAPYPQLKTATPWAFVFGLLRVIDEVS